MALNDVKEITIPEGSVKKIENSNGNIIWGSQSAFPYRRLEYIHFNGAECLDSGYTPAASTSCKLKANVWGNTTIGDGNEALMGSYDGARADAARRLSWFNYRTNSVYRTSIGSTWTNTNVASDNDIHVFGLSFGSTFKYVWPTIRNATETINQYYVEHVNSVAFTGFASHMGIGTVRTAVGWDTNRYSKINVYQFISKTGAAYASGNILSNLIPCQRKSDNVCGMYDTIGKVFHPMIGTNITNSAAGPLVDEYWDLTA